MAPKSNGVPCGSFRMFDASTATKSEATPVVWKPMTLSWSQMWYCPWVQG